MTASALPKLWSCSTLLWVCEAGGIPLTRKKRSREDAGGLLRGNGRTVRAMDAFFGILLVGFVLFVIIAAVRGS
ncbi:hypothetical protein, partial [Streptomyces lunaelactis]|uniref:hypothetical protein n=1 Tax=Streptomyces lunaelactis TaxID=1535768 RepID=UPI001C30FDB9